MLAQKGSGRRVPASRAGRWVLLGGSVVLPLPAIRTGISTIALLAPPGHRPWARKKLPKGPFCPLVPVVVIAEKVFHLLEEKCLTSFI